MKNDLRRAVLEYLEHNPSRAFKTKELARALHLPKQGDEYQALKQALHLLQEQEKIERAEGQKWRVMRRTELLEGIMRILKQGGGMCSVPGNPEREIFIPKRRLYDAQDGDRVRVRVLAHKAGEHDEGDIVEFLGEAPRTVVGTVKTVRGKAYVEVDGKGAQRDVAVHARDLAGAREGDKVVVEVRGQGERSDMASGTVSEVLGRVGNPRVELAAIARRYGLSLEFPREVDAEALAIPSAIPEAEIAKRLDLRDHVCFTIDPDDAKDFDDAVSIEVDGEGNFLLGVHIADVSHYVVKDSELDREAYTRGTSVYLVDGVIPMLPERLSNHLCSLREGQDRLTYSAIMTVSPRGAVKDFAFRKTVIRSRRRFTYDEAQQVIHDGRGDCVEQLLMMSKLATVLMKKRFREGSIDFSVPEVKFVLNAAGFPTEIIAKERLHSMRLIEEFMLLANKTVAAAVRAMRVRDVELPFLYRVHDLPDPEKVRELVEFVRHLGLDIRLDAASSQSFQRMIEALRDKPESAVVQGVTIRSMAKAVYSEKNIGHFGLGFALYTHFTSPIRRYPDLIVHRMLHEYQEGHTDAVLRTYGKRIVDIAKHSSERERLAVEAERASRKIKEVEYMQRHLGDEFDAVISGVTSYGLYVELVPILVEGLVHVRTMDDDYYDFDARRKALVGKRTRRMYRLGSTVRVQVSRVDNVEKQIDFVIVAGHG
ncbi:MAG: ribonuclease R [Ignavibacteria bacterium]|nr:ribonuclease R [Ignavibacteria bacterium]